MCKPPSGYSLAAASALALMLAGSAECETKLPPPAKTKVDFTRDVKPILQANCYSCHGPKQQLSGLRLDLMVTAMRGGDSGPVIVAGDSAKSKLILRLAGSELGLQMPPTGPLSAEEIGVIRAWIDQGPLWADTSLEEAAPHAKIEPADPKGEPLFRAIRSGSMAAVRAILKRDPSLVNVRGAGGTTPLMQAALYASEECMRLLLERGADVNARNAVGATALMRAATDGGKVRLLVERGAQVDAKSDDNKTALMIAARQPGLAATVKLLLDRGADVSAKDIAGATVLIQAASAGDAETMRLLIDKGAEVNAATSGGATALMSASRIGCVSCVQLLLESGANVKAATKRGLTALISVAAFSEPQVVKILLEKGADVNAKDEDGRTALMLAAYSDHFATETVRLLLAKGADVNARSALGETALSLAKQRGETPVVKLLFKAGAKE